MVYLIADTERKYCKIGISTKPLSRLSCIQTNIPFKLEILRVVDGGRELEIKLHKKFSKKKAMGEWFLYDTEIQQCFDGMSEITLGKEHKNQTKGVAKFTYNSKNNLSRNIIIDKPITDNAKIVFQYCLQNHKDFKIKMSDEIAGISAPTLYRAIGQLLRIGLLSKANYIKDYFVNPYYIIKDNSLVATKDAQ